MAKRPYGNVPIDMGVREASKRLDVSPGWLSNVAKITGHPCRPDRARLEGGREVPSWSSQLINQLLRRRASWQPS